jgi:hypothetical protein
MHPLISDPPRRLERSGEKLEMARWAAARLAFIIYIGFSVFTVVGGFLTAPLMTWCFFDDWRFWRFARAGPGMWLHAYRVIGMMFGESRAFMLSVPLTSRPRSAPDPSSAALRVDWQHGFSCGECTNCCKPGGHACPLLDEKGRRCRGYNSFYWRYFNCGRFPSVTEEILFYDCRKWVVNLTCSPCR